MPNKFELQDYEPVTRSSRSRVSESEDSEDESFQIRPLKAVSASLDLEEGRYGAPPLRSAPATLGPDKSGDLKPLHSPVEQATLTMRRISLRSGFFRPMN